MQIELLIFEVIILIFSVVIHEVSHGVVAEHLGDPTARNAGRLTLNPLKHLDPVGSLLVPGVLVFLKSSIIFGWAKPVPYDPRNLKDPLKGGGLIAVAGPLSNGLLAVIFGILFRVGVEFGLFSVTSSVLPTLFVEIVRINVGLAIFNLVPIPPLDGSKILFALLPQKAEKMAMIFEQYGFLILLFVLFSGVLNALEPIMIWIMRLLLG